MASTEQTARIEAARNELHDCLYSGAGSEATLRATRELQAAQEAAETLDQRCFRLGLAAADEDARAGHLIEEAEQDELVVIARRAKWGADDVTAANIATRAAATRLMAENAKAEANRLRSQASALRRASSKREAA